MPAAPGTGTAGSLGVPAGRGGSLSRAWEMGGAGAGDGRTVRGFNEPPNPLIRFLARETGLFSLFRLRWGEEIVENRDFSEKMGDAEAGGKRRQGWGARAVGECPVCFAGWREMPSSPSARRREPRSGPTSETSTGSPRYGCAGEGGTGGAKLWMEPWREGKGQGPS